MAVARASAAALAFLSASFAFTCVAVSPLFFFASTPHPTGGVSMSPNPMVPPLWRNSTPLVCGWYPSALRETCAVPSPQCCAASSTLSNDNQVSDEPKRRPSTSLIGAPSGGEVQRHLGLATSAMKVKAMGERESVPDL
jgi:hypothetical protein